MNFLRETFNHLYQLSLDLCRELKLILTSGKISQVHAPEVHQVLQIPQQPAIPPPHPQPLNIKIPHVPTVKIPYHGPKVATPHLIGVEHYVEPQIKVVKAAPISHHPWD